MRNASGVLVVDFHIFGNPHAVSNLITDGKLSGHALRPELERQFSFEAASNFHAYEGPPFVEVDS